MTTDILEFSRTPYINGEIVVDGAGGNIGRVMGETLAQEHPAYHHTLVQLADGSDTTFLQERVRMATEQEIEQFEREFAAKMQNPNR